jgi:hypothetical protein
LVHFFLDRHKRQDGPFSIFSEPKKKKGADILNQAR